MTFTEHCDICGQELTEASGRWTVIMQDRGIYHRPTEKMRCCVYCMDQMQEWLRKFSIMRKMERKEALTEYEM